SVDGAQWDVVCDRREGTGHMPGGELEAVWPAAVQARFLRLTITGAANPKRGPYVMELSAFAQPTPRALQGAVGEINRQYDATNVPLANTSREWSASAWRGERVHGQFVV